MKGSFLFLSCLMLLLGLCALASAEESGGYTVMCQNLRAPSSKDLADPALSPAHRSELFKTLLAQYAPDVVGLQEAKGVMAGTAGKLSPGHGLRLYGGRQNQPRRAGGYTAILYKQSRFELLKEGVFWLTDTPDVPSSIVDRYMRNCTWELLLDQETEQSVYVFSTHLHDPMGAAADDVRALQTQYLLEKAVQVMQAHPEASSLIMGDFNARPDNDPASASKNCYNKDLKTQINAAGYQNARVATEYGAKGSVHGFGKYSAILDYLFVSADFQIEDFSVLDEKINGDFYMRVLVLGGSTASVQAGHQVTLCTPYYALGEEAAGS